jgi:hypothetical protein
VVSDPIFNEDDVEEIEAPRKTIILDLDEPNDAGH